MIYYIADTHFGDGEVMELYKRPFRNVESMNEAMIYVWNKKVKDGDTVYIVGDLFSHCEDPEAILQRLRGEKYLIIGEHDWEWLRRVEAERYFAGVEYKLKIRDGNRVITLCHDPLLTRENWEKGYMVHGHLHDKTDEDFALPIWERVLNAGVDINGYRPVTFKEMREHNGLFRLAHYLEQWEDEDGGLPF